jgi:hypothetical protein
MERKGKLPKVFGIKTQRLLVAFATAEVDMVRFFCISVKMDFE